MNNFYSVAEWMTNSFPYIRMIIMILLILFSIFIIFIILIQPGNNGSVSAISGQSDSYYKNNKKDSIEGKLKRITIFCSIFLGILIILFYVTMILYPAT